MLKHIFIFHPGKMFFDDAFWKIVCRDPLFCELSKTKKLFIFCFSRDFCILSWLLFFFYLKAAKTAPISEI